VFKTITAQIDPELLRSIPKDSGNLKLNMDAVYDRPFIKLGKLPVSLGGYVEGNYQYTSKNGISEGNQFQFRRLTLFISSTIYNRIKFLNEIEFEDGTKKSMVEFASVDRK
jgi:hypothetical protein